MTNEMKIRVKEILNDESFNMEIVNAENMEAIHEALTARGIEVTQEEMEAVLAEMAAEVKEAVVDEELTEEELEAVAGGNITIFVIATILCLTVIMLKYYLAKYPNSAISKKARRLMK